MEWYFNSPGIEISNACNMSIEYFHRIAQNLGDEVSEFGQVTVGYVSEVIIQSEQERKVCEVTLYLFAICN